MGRMVEAVAPQCGGMGMTDEIRGKDYLSKSLFIRGLQCHKSLYLHKFHPELKDEVTEEQESKFQLGRDVGEYAQEIFPGGVEIPYDGLSLEEQIDMTRKEMERGTGVLYEAAFSCDGVFIKVDILRKHRGAWEIYEVKAATSLKDHYVYDMAVQYHVMIGLGIPVSKAFLVHLNNGYERHGEIDPHGLFTRVDLTETVSGMRDEIKEKVVDMRRMLGQGEPDVEIGPHCCDPYDCDFMGHCWRHIPEESVFSLKGKGVDKFALYRNGIVHLKDVPLHVLSGGQKIQLECALEKKDLVDQGAVRAFVESLWYPLCFLDFETTLWVPIPLFDGTRPYQQVPFQFSLHRQESRTARLEHCEYLGAPNEDPRKGFVEHLLRTVPEDACVLVYNAAFEKRVLGDVTSWFPEHEGRIHGIMDNIVDLMTPFRNKSVYSWKMEGSYSIKYVLPALVPAMGYDGLEIRDGQMASNAWLESWAMKNEEERAGLRKALLAYCEMDTLAMVKVLEVLKRLVS